MEKLSAGTNALNWFEIPVNDTARAKKFYETVFAIQMDTREIRGMEKTFFPGDPQSGSGKVSGALVKGGNFRPSAEGAVVYLNANPVIQTVIDRIEKAGGKITMPKTLISKEIGYMAFFSDSEGNAVALHAGN